MNIIIGIITSIIASIIIYLFSFYIKKTKSLIPQKRSHIFIDLNNKINISSKFPSVTLYILLKRLYADQKHSGIHQGQFGKSANLKEETLYQLNEELIQVKPLLYLTGWPCFILKKHSKGKKALQLSLKGIEKLFRDSKIYVYQSAIKNTLPYNQPQIISIRHTIRGIQILLYLDKKNHIGIKALDLMLESSNKWQNSDGGWAQCNIDYKSSDLWGSSYAISLLHKVKNGDFILPKGTVKKSETLLMKTLNYFKEQWEKNKWAYGQTSFEQNSILIFHEIANVIKIYDKNLTENIKNMILSWLTPSLFLSKKYLEKCETVSEASSYARVAYALFLLDIEPDTWINLYNEAIYNLDQNLNSADLSFLIDMTYYLKNWANKGIKRKLPRGQVFVF